MNRFAVLVAVVLLSMALAGCTTSAVGSSDAAQSGGTSQSSGAVQGEDASAEQSSGAIPQEVQPFVGRWASDRALLQIDAVGDHCKCSITWGSSYKEETQWEYDPCLYDGASLVCEGLGVKTNIVYDEDGEVESSEEEFSDGSASFSLNDDGTLTWIDFKTYPDEEGLVFTSAEND